MRAASQHYISHDKTSALIICANILLGIFFLGVSFPTYANEEESAVASADAAVDDVVDHTINTEGLIGAKSISQSDGNIILQRDAPSIQVAKQPEQKPLKKKSELVETKPTLNAFKIPREVETK
jgi:hypothetical protein